MVSAEGNGLNQVVELQHNYGLIILMLTIILKTLLFPIAYKTYMSSTKMRLLKPELDVINKKFSDPADAMKKKPGKHGAI